MTFSWLGKCTLPDSGIWSPPSFIIVSKTNYCPPTTKTLMSRSYIVYTQFDISNFTPLFPVKVDRLLASDYEQPVSTSTTDIHVNVYGSISLWSAWETDQFWHLVPFFFPRHWKHCNFCEGLLWMVGMCLISFNLEVLWKVENHQYLMLSHGLPVGGLQATTSTGKVPASSEYFLSHLLILLYGSCSVKLLIYSQFFHSGEYMQQLLTVMWQFC